jgi:hypothetical protein
MNGGGRDKVDGVRVGVGPYTDVYAWRERKLASGFHLG